MHLNKGSNDTICIVTEQLYQLSVIWINKEKGFIFFKQNADLDGLFIYVNRPKIWSLLWKRHTFLCSLLWTRDTQSLRPRQAGCCFRGWAWGPISGTSSLKLRGNSNVLPVHQIMQVRYRNIQQFFQGFRLLISLTIVYSKKSLLTVLWLHSQTQIFMSLKRRILRI